MSKKNICAFCNKEISHPLLVQSVVGEKGIYHEECAKDLVKIKLENEQPITFIETFNSMEEVIEYKNRYALTISNIGGNSENEFKVTFLNNKETWLERAEKHTLDKATENSLDAIGRKNVKAYVKINNQTLQEINNKVTEFGPFRELEERIKDKDLEIDALNNKIAQQEEIIKEERLLKEEYKQDIKGNEKVIESLKIIIKLREILPLSAIFKIYKVLED